MRLVRILRSTVMVRVGGGWCALDEFLVKNDPCRGRFSPPKNCLRIWGGGGWCTILNLNVVIHVHCLANISDHRCDPEEQAAARREVARLTQLIISHEKGRKVSLGGLPYFSYHSSGGSSS